MNKFAAALAALTLGAASPAFALTGQAKASSADAQIAAEVQDYVGRVVGWSQSYQVSVTEQADALMDLATGLETAADHYGNGRAKEGAAWARRWSEEQKQRWDAIQKRFDQAAAVPMPKPPIPELVATVAKYADTPDLVGRYLGQNRALADRMIVRIAAVAAGDDEAARTISGEMMDVSIAMIEGENQMVAASALAAAPGHPQRELMNASRHANLAMIALMQAQKALLLGQSVDEAALAARLRQHAGAVEASAKSIEDSAQRMLAKTRATPELAGTPLLATIEKAFASYPESAAAERAIAAAFGDVAARIDAPGEVDLDTLLASGEHIGTLVERRLVIDTQRRAHLQ